jgi:hypothetical protein
MHIDTIKDMLEALRASSALCARLATDGDMHPEIRQEAVNALLKIEAVLIDLIHEATERKGEVAE